jgi:hypothetical protein
MTQSGIDICHTFFIKYIKPDNPCIKNGHPSIFHILKTLISNSIKSDIIFVKANSQ